MNKLILYAFSAVLLFSASCKKGSTSRTTCTSTLYGYTMPISMIFGTSGVGTCNFGIINESTSGFSTLGTFSSSVYSNQAAYNTSDNCYYVFKIYSGTDISQSPLYKISTSGTVTTLTNSATNNLSSLTYNRVTGNLYCLNLSSRYLAEITTTGTTFSTTNLIPPVHPFIFNSIDFVDAFTVDNTTGNMYYVTGDTATYYVEKYIPGSSAATVIASGTGAWGILGMKFNTNDNMLYAIRENYPAYGYDFIKINPATGVVSTIVSLNPNVNSEISSACIDPCSNRYIYSSAVDIQEIYILDQLSMTGTVLQNDTTATPYQGLDVN